MESRHQIFWLPRKGNTPEEYEDAFAADPIAGRFALADGATESGFAKCWADLLVQDFVSQTDARLEKWASRLPALQQQWQARVGNQDLPWYAKAKFERGAFSTFLSLLVRPAAKGSFQWRALAVGDTCLFHCREQKLLKAFPLQKSSQFNNYPKLVGSRTATEEVRDKLAEYGEGLAQAGDQFWLMTDALAEWSLAQHEAGSQPWAELARLWEDPSDKQFAQQVEQLRRSGRLRNDDVTLLAITL